jgi:hypothetical protein
VERDRETVVVAGLAGERDRLGEIVDRGRMVVLHVRDRAEVGESDCESWRPALLAEERGGLLVQARGSVELRFGDRGCAELGDGTRGTVVVS